MNSAVPQSRSYDSETVTSGIQVAGPDVTQTQEMPVTADESASTNCEHLGIYQQFARAAGSERTVDGYLKAVAAIVSEHSDNLALWTSKRDEDGNCSQIHAISDDNANAVWPLVENECRQLIKHATTTNAVCSSSVEKFPQYQIIVAPIIIDNNAEYVVVACFSVKKQTLVRQQWLMGMVGQSFTNWFQQRQLEQADTKTRSLNDALSLVQSLDQTTDVRQASMAIVNHLRRLCTSEQVAICFCLNGAHGELTAISDVERIEVEAESNKLIKHACNQAIVENKMLVYPHTDGEPEAPLLPLEHYCKANRLPGCINIPLTNEDGKILGAILVAISEQRINQPGFPEYLARMAKMITGHLEIVLRANRGIYDLAKSQLQKLKQASWTKPVLIAMGLLFMTLCVPWPYRVSCDCEVQPVMRRFIAAPYAGILEKTLVEHGDVVKQGQVLAKMDGRQVRIELAGLKAEYEGAKKRCDSALAKSDYATSQIARSEMNRLQSKIDLLEQQVVNLEIRSPIDGIIVSGDLEKVEGAPLELGQTLFEVGPLDQMLAEVAIPESEIPHVAAGMNVAIKLNAFPFKSWHGEIQNIHPRTEIVNDESVFIAQVELSNDELLLRPGLKGSAKVRSSAHPIGWNLFHQAWESVRYWMIW